MPTLFVIDNSGKVPSPLVQRLMRAGYHVLCLSECRTALDVLRCVRPDLMIVDVSARPRAAAEGLLKVLGRGVDDEPRAARAPVMVVGATLEDYRVLSELLDDGEVVPATHSSPDEVVRRVECLVAPDRAPRVRPAATKPAPGAAGGPASPEPPEPWTVPARGRSNGMRLWPGDV